MRILIVEDEPAIAVQLEQALAAQGYVTDRTGDGAKADFLVQTEGYDLVILDLGLPRVDGLTLLKRWRAAELAVPVLVLTARGSWHETVEGIDAGADDYVAKPFKPRELMARVAAVMRRSPKKGEMRTDDRIATNGIVIDALRHEVVVDGEPLSFTASEFRIIQLLASQPGRVFTRDQIASRAMGQVLHPTDRNIDVHMKTIRKKLGDRADLIETVRGVGYRFSDRPRVSN